jgi:hypothetical protein
MADCTIFRDKRLEGTTPLGWALHTYELDQMVSLHSAFANLNTWFDINGEKFRALFILCHGFAGWNRGSRMSLDAGGMGLQLGKERVLHGNVSLWEAIRDKVENIIVYACAPANTEKGNEGTTADGKYLMGALAIHTNAYVYAADRIQWYHKHIMNFGKWEGRILKFSPGGQPPTYVSEVPVEISAI